MAHTVKFNGKVTGNALVAYNIAASVGSTGINKPVDVKLVQALLRLFFSELEGTRPAALANDAPLEIDGVVGPITQRHIRAFKDSMRRSNNPTVADGKIDPFIMPQSGALTPHSKQRFVLTQINDSCDVRSAKQGKGDLFQKLPTREDIPADLREALKTVVFEF